MDKTQATLIAGALAAFVGFFSALLSHLSLRYQLKKQAEESERVRVHSIKTQAMPNKIQSLEQVWFFLIEIEGLEVIPNKIIEPYIKATLWLPEDVRVLALSLLGSSITTETRVCLIAELRAKIIDLSKDYSC